MATTLFQIYLFLQVFVLGAAAALAVKYSYAHRHPAKPAAEVPEPPLEKLPEATKDRLVHNAENQFQSAMNRSAVHLQADLESSADQINKLLMRLATDTVSGEMERYEKELARLHSEAQTHLGTIRTDVEARKAEIMAKMEQEIGAEKLRLIKQIDTKLADAVTSFLVETLSHNIDLGSQSAYLVGLLEEHKAEFVKEVTGGPEPTA